MTKPLYIVAGARTPFCKAGTLLGQVPVYDLASAAMAEALARSEVDGGDLSEVVMGNVGGPAEAANVARVSALLASIPEHVPAVTVNRNCASGMEAVISACMRIRGGSAERVLACGGESMSNYPFLFQEKTRMKFINMLRARSGGDKWKALTSFRLKDFKPRVALEEGLKDFVAEDNMGQTAERLAREWHIKRDEQDEFALLSHQKAEAGTGNRAEEILPFWAPKQKALIQEDNGPRKGQSMEKLGKLKPYFDRRFGSVTAGNASQLTDGASALVISDHLNGSPEPLGRILAWKTVGLDPKRMGLGPALAIPLLLKEAGMAKSDIALFEINEAFAAQVIACQRAMADADFCAGLGLTEPFGEIPEDKLNVNGGAISLGHPVGSTANRLILTILHELHRRGEEFGVVSVCVGGGQGSAILVQAGRGA